MCLWDSGCNAADRSPIGPDPHPRVPDCSSLPHPPCCFAASTGTACIVWHAARPRDVERCHPGPESRPKAVDSLSKPTLVQSYDIHVNSVAVPCRRPCGALQGEDDSVHEAKWLADLRKTVEACGAHATAQTSGAQVVNTAKLPSWSWLRRTMLCLRDRPLQTFADLLGISALNQMDPSKLRRMAHSMPVIMLEGTLQTMHRRHPRCRVVCQGHHASGRQDGGHQGQGLPLLLLLPSPGPKPYVTVPCTLHPCAHSSRGPSVG